MLTIPTTITMIPHLAELSQNDSTGIDISGDRNLNIIHEPNPIIDKLNTNHPTLYFVIRVKLEMI